jgi:integrase
MILAGGAGMPKRARELGALDVKRLAQRGGEKVATFAVGGVMGLYLQVLPSGAASWLLRVKVGERRREIGLGAYPEIMLAQARDRAREARNEIRDGVDPVEKRKAAKSSLIAAQRRGLTFAEAMERYLDSKMDGFRNVKHKAQWRSTLECYAKPQLGALLVSDITVQDVLRVLQPIWQEKTETASRLRGRIEAVLSWATVAGHRTGDNPARWGGNLKELLPVPPKVALVENQPALALDDAPRWFSALRSRDGMGSRALEFATLTAARSGEVRGATWSEIDLAKGIWTVPAARMKMQREHRVPLGADGISLLKTLPRFEGSDLVFPASRGGQLSDMTLSAAMRRIHEADLAKGGSGFFDRVSKRPAVPHGVRSVFRDWASERTSYPGDLAEFALAHKISNTVEAAYRRGDMIEKRRTMMSDWAAFLTGRKQDAKVVRLA